MTILLLDAALLALTLALARRKRLLASRDWLRLARSHADAPEHLATNSTQTLHGQREDPTLHPRMVERMIAATFELLGSDDFVAKTNPPPLHLLAPADSDWSGFAPWLLQRVNDINAVGGPRMRVVHWRTLADSGRLPRWPQDAALVLDLADLLEAWIARQDAFGKVDGRIVCLSMFSHRWETPNAPDTPADLKARSLARYGEIGTCAVFPDHRFDYFFWIDYCGVHQDDRLAKTLGAAKLPLYGASVVEILFFFTPEYEARAWTRLERAIGYVYAASPMFVYLDAQYLALSQPPNVAELCASHACFGRDAKTGGLTMAINDPLSGALTDESDRELLRKMLRMLRASAPINAKLKASYAARAYGQAAAVDLAASTLAVDTEHYRIDCEEHSVTARQQQQVSRMNVRRTSTQRTLSVESTAAPLAARHFRGQGRLGTLVLSSDGAAGGADIRLLSARKLIAHIDGGGRMVRRQALEAAGTDLFVDDATARALLPELETEEEDSFGVHRCTFPGVAALSYAWVTPADPDPERAQLLALRPVLVWYVCERARKKLGTVGKGEARGRSSSLHCHAGLGCDPDPTMQTADFGVFIDFMSMHQPDDFRGPTPAYTKPAQQASFKRALANIGLLYGHRGTTVLKLTATPLPPGGDPQRVYSQRGWTHLERRLGDLEAPASNSLDVSAWPAAEAARAATDEHGQAINRLGVLRPTAAQCGAPRLCVAEEELAAQADHASIGSPGTLGALIRGGRGAPVSPAHFAEELTTKVFSVDADRAVCAELYRGVAAPLLAAVEELKFTSLGWAAAEWRHLGGALACCAKLRELRLPRMGLDDAGMAALCGELGGGDSPELEVLELDRNAIGDAGLRVLGDALERGWGRGLAVLNLQHNQVGDGGMRHLVDVIGRGAAPALKELRLFGNAASDEAARRAAEAALRRS